ncbi:Pre-mRNA-splicing factor cef1 [Mycoemilia scoparia]|uniref:Pre-mRNA-splicing factor cef1 n=1 Tax=Mycoemilia scoparia TaxID=417184 RepID=A0A9W8DSI9_9FUNG|nr:Pre-mRNA-splicing factor cef1 [Mycoemilia scoparia]
MKVVIKGGVWKNTEDEVLKAAVMKYGKNQWPRIASLLAKKTPKQCKARWFEWLDPSIKKTDWSKDEDEKLLHLAKLMPTQWRTIAPLVGRTAAQCLERYQKLLDDAEGQVEGSDLGLQGPAGGEGANAAGDARRLRPGEVDPNPETKSARPDPVDMDEDEKDMLSEARARLANTQGKKAKRKARERQLEEARRLAALQKRRELKAAGIEVGRKKKLKHMDYNANIPLEKKPVPGFYDTTEELKVKVDKSAMKGKRLQDLEPKKPWEVGEDDDEKKKRKRESKNKQDSAATIVNRQRAEALAAAAQAEREDAEKLAKRKRLQLPTPQVTERDLETIIQIGRQGENARNLAQSANVSSGTLLSDYTTPTPMRDIEARTPRVPAQSNTILSEARNLRAMTVQQTPLLGEENTPLNTSGGTGYGGITPLKTVAQTPNPMMTPARGHGSATQTRPDGAPMRDEFGLNAGTPGFSNSSGQKSLRMQLAKKLASLPAPKNNFEVVVPDEAGNDESNRDELGDGHSASKPQDQELVDKKRLEKQRVEEELELKRRTQAVRRDLPRPVSFVEGSLTNGDAGRGGGMATEIQKLINEEMELLTINDASRFPPRHARSVSLEPRHRLQDISDQAIQAARDAIAEEMKQTPVLPDILKEAIPQWHEYENSGIWDANKSEFVAKKQATTDVLLQKYRGEWKQRRKQMSLESERATKIEKRLNITLGGYQARSKALSKSIKEAFSEYEKALCDYGAFRSLQMMEGASISSRIEGATEEVRELDRREAELQAKYSELSRRKIAAQEKLIAVKTNGESHASSKPQSADQQ